MCTWQHRRIPQTTTPIQCHDPIHPTLRDNSNKSLLAISTQLHIFIFTYTYTKRQKLSNILYCQKISLTHKTHKLQHKSNYERERERPEKERELKYLPEVRGSAAVARWRLRFLFPDLALPLPISLLLLPISQSPIWAKSISNFAIAELLWAFSVVVAALLSLFFFWLRIAAFNALLSRCCCWEVIQVRTWGSY